MSPTPLTLMSWNVNGIRATIKKGFWDWLDTAQPDILGIQETKIQADQLTDEMKQPPGGYHTYWTHAVKKGYSGVALFSKTEPLDVQYGFEDEERFDTEGRIIIATYPEFVFYTIYYPNGQMNDERLAYKLDFYDAFLRHVNQHRDDGKKIVICGDVNTAHKPIDLARPKANEKISGFLPIEREHLDRWTEQEGYIDTFREFETGPDHYSWWNMRAAARERNVGWRIDYMYVTKNLRPQLTAAAIHPDVMGSDHCPVSIQLAVQV